MKNYLKNRNNYKIKRLRKKMACSSADVSGYMDLDTENVIDHIESDHPVSNTKRDIIDARWIHS